MRTRLKVMLTTVLGIVVTAGATAQGLHLFGGLGGLDMLLQNSGVLKELKLNDEQLTRIKEVVREIRLRHREDWERLRDLSEEERRERLPEVIKLVSDETMKSLQEVLSPSQIRRLKQIKWQNDGLTAFSDEEVSRTLKLSAEQKERIRVINAEVTREWHALVPASSGLAGPDGNRYREVLRKLTVIRKEALEKGVGLLSQDQKKVWKNVVGEPYEVQFEQPRGGRGSGTRGRGHWNDHLVSATRLAALPVRNFLTNPRIGLR